MKEKIIGIGGGVGPMAGVKLHEYIINQTISKGDRDHLKVLHVSLSSEIPDRTEYLLGKTKEDPALSMLKVMRLLQKAVGFIDGEIVVGIPCNTFHAAKIWNRFTDLLKKKKTKVRVLHMIQETANFMEQFLPDAKNIGLMSTTGTRKADVYRDAFEPRGYCILEVPEKFQSELHNAIYDKEWGIKAKSPVTQQAQLLFRKYADILCDRGAQAIILGCTEIPLVLPEQTYKGVPLIDPMLILARALIREANPKKLKQM